MESVYNTPVNHTSIPKSKIHVQVQYSAAIGTPTENYEFQKKLAESYMSDEFIDRSAKRKAFKEYRNDPTRTLTGVVAAAIPIVHSVASGAVAEGDHLLKASAALSAGKNWGLFIGGAVIFTKLARAVISKFEPLKDFAQNNLGTTAIASLLTGVAAGRTTIHYGNIALAKIMGKHPDERIKEAVSGSKIFQKETLKTVFNDFSNFAQTKTGKFAGNVIGIGLIALIAKNLFDFGKIDYNISKTKDKLKDKRFEASNQVVKELLENKN